MIIEDDDFVNHRCVPKLVHFPVSSSHISRAHIRNTFSCISGHPVHWNLSTGSSLDPHCVLNGSCSGGASEINTGLPARPVRIIPLLCLRCLIVFELCNNRLVERLGDLHRETGIETYTESRIETYTDLHRPCQRLTERLP